MFFFLISFYFILVEKIINLLKEIKELLQKLRALEEDQILEQSVAERVFKFLRENIPNFFARIANQPVITYPLCGFIVAAFALFLLHKTAFFDVEDTQERIKDQCKRIESRLDQALSSFINAQRPDNKDRAYLTKAALLKVRSCIARAESLQSEVIGHRNIYAAASTVSGALVFTSVASCTYFKADLTHPLFAASAVGAAFFFYLSVKCGRIAFSFYDLQNTTTATLTNAMDHLDHIANHNFDNDDSNNNIVNNNENNNENIVENNEAEVEDEDEDNNNNNNTEN